jgi:outer membrane protein assembly factor BamB
MIVKLACSVMICMCLFIGARAQNWSSFRGPKASGVADVQSVPTHWDAEKTLNIRWKTPIPGLGHSSPIIWGNKVFITTAINSDGKTTFSPKDGGIDLAKDDMKHSWRIYCLDKNTGRILWERTAHEGIPRARRHVKASQANPTPVTDGRYVVALMNSEGLFAYDLNGKLLWQKDLGVLNPGLYQEPSSEWGQSSSPVIYKDLVIVQSDGHKQSFIAAFNLKDGKQVWRVERGEITSWSTPTIYESKTRTELIANGGHYIRGYDPLTGKELWRFFDNDTQVKQQAPIVANDLLIVTSGYPAGRPMYAFRAGGAQGDISLKKGEEINQFLAWRTAKGSPYTPTPIVYGDYLYVCSDNGVFSAYQVKTGEVVYQQRLPSSFSASPVAAGGKLYLSSEDGEVFVIKAGAKFELLATNPMGEALMSTPALSEGNIILRGQSHVFAVSDSSDANRKTTSPDKNRDLK